MDIEKTAPCMNLPSHSGICSENGIGVIIAKAAERGILGPRDRSRGDRDR